MLKGNILTGVVFLWASLLVNGQRLAFNWTSIPASDPNILTSIPECGNVNFTLRPTDNGIYEAVPPFYLISFALSGPVNVDPLHGDEVNGGTVVLDAMRHARGALVLLYVVDSVGNSSDGDGFSIENGTTSNCHPSVPFSPMNATVDKNQVSTCDTVQVFVTGGRRPYTITTIGMANETSPVQNFTMGPDDDTYEVVNRASPGEGLLFFASDADGQRSFATTIVTSVGSSDLSCNGRQSRSFQSNGGSSSISPKSKSSTGAIVGGVIGGIALFIILSVVVVCVWKRRQRTTKVKHSGASLDMGKDEGVPLNTGESLPYIVTQWQEPRHSDGAGRPAQYPNEKRPSPRSPADAALLENTGGDQRAPAREVPAPTDANALLTPPVPTNVPTTRAVVGQTDSQITNTTRRSDQIEEQPRRIVRHIDAEEAVELPPEYRDWAHGHARR